MQVFNNKPVCKFDMTCSYIYFISKEMSYIIQFISKPNQFESLNMSLVPEIENRKHKLDIGNSKKLFLLFSVGTKSSVTYLNILPVKALFWKAL